MVFSDNCRTFRKHFCRRCGHSSGEGRVGKWSQVLPGPRLKPSRTSDTGCPCHRLVRVIAPLPRGDHILLPVDPSCPLLVALEVTRAAAKFDARFRGKTVQICAVRRSDAATAQWRGIPQRALTAGEVSQGMGEHLPDDLMGERNDSSASQPPCGKSRYLGKVNGFPWPGKR